MKNVLGMSGGTTTLLLVKCYLSIGQFQKCHDTLCLSLQNFAKALFLFSHGTYNGPKRHWKQCLCKILEGQTKSIMVFLKVPIGLG